MSSAILTKYLAGGGPATLGFPTTDGVNVTGGRASYFTGARIYTAEPGVPLQHNGPDRRWGPE